MSEEIKSHHLRALAEEIKPRTLRALACDIEDCHEPQSWADYCRAAAAMLEIKDARIKELEAALANARREGMEEAAQIALSQPERIGEKLFNASKFQPDLLMTATCISMKREIAAAIRAAAKEVKP